MHQRATLSMQERGRDVLLCAATGGGKSAAYQAAVYAAPDTLTVVVSPLVELIREQTERTDADLAALAKLPGGKPGRARCSPHDAPPPPRHSVQASHGGEPEATAAPRDAPTLREGTLAYAVVHEADLRVIYITPEELAAKESGRWTAARCVTRSRALAAEQSPCLLLLLLLLTQ
ncbi:DEAD/DEAH box helicase, partial [bacterium]|nr:DEAD/DEAH box helicase [bacterium]